MGRPKNAPAKCKHPRLMLLGHLLDPLGLEIMCRWCELHGTVFVNPEDVTWESEPLPPKKGAATP